MSIDIGCQISTAFRFPGFTEKLPTGRTDHPFFFMAYLPIYLPKRLF
jgi:hypothetical protein